MLKKQDTVVKRKVVEFQGFEEDYKLGDTITVEHFIEGEFVMLQELQKEKDFKGL